MFKEADRFPPFLRARRDAFDRDGAGVVFQVVDDGSRASERDAVATVVRAAGPLFREPLLLDANVGKGGAVLSGWAATAGAGIAWQGFLDGDGAISAAVLRRVIERARTSDADAIFATRIRMLGRTIERQPTRHYLARVFATLVGMSIDSSVYDSQCGLKLVRTDVLETIRPRLAEQGFAFDVDLLAGLRTIGATMIEMPIDWIDVAGSKVHVVRDAFRLAWALRRIRRRWRG